MLLRGHSRTSWHTTFRGPYEPSIDKEAMMFKQGKLLHLMSKVRRNRFVLSSSWSPARLFSSVRFYLNGDEQVDPMGFQAN